MDGLFVQGPGQCAQLKSEYREWLVWCARDVSEACTVLVPCKVCSISSIKQGGLYRMSWILILVKGGMTSQQHRLH